jgi:hypothetical protein
MLFKETVAVYCENHTERTDTVRTSQETHYISATEPNRLMLFGETVAVYCENHPEHKYILWTKCKFFFKACGTNSDHRALNGCHSPTLVPVVTNVCGLPTSLSYFTKWYWSTRTHLIPYSNVFQLYYGCHKKDCGRTTWFFLSLHLWIRELCHLLTFPNVIRPWPT